MRSLFTSESVTEGHPDKICDQISDAILDECLRQDPESRVAAETATKNGAVWVFGEITTKGFVDVDKIVRKTLSEIGYNNSKLGIDAENCGVFSSIVPQSSDISQGVSSGKGLHKEQGAGDQGMMFGYAVNETPQLMPLPIVLAHGLTKKLAEVRKNGTLPYLGPDGKSQVTVEYEGITPQRIHTIVVSNQHTPKVTHDKIKADIIKYVINPICGEYIDDETIIHVNPTGAFIIGGPQADAGLTGRKIIVDTYGGMGRHGGGAFSGKDPSKVDRSAAYCARYIAKNIVAAELAKECEVQLAYAIGVAEPVSVFVNTFGTGIISDDKLMEIVCDTFLLTPNGIINHLKLRRPIYQLTASNGHFGNELAEFTWEKTDKVDALKQKAEKLQ